MEPRQHLSIRTRRPLYRQQRYGNRQKRVGDGKRQSCFPHHGTFNAAIFTVKPITNHE